MLENGIELGKKGGGGVDRCGGLDGLTYRLGDLGREDKREGGRNRGRESVEVRGEEDKKCRGDGNVCDLLSRLIAPFLLLP